MPLVQVTLSAGRTPDQVRALISALTTAVTTSIGAPKEAVRVIVSEVPPTHWAAGDVTLAERTPTDG
ncbi:2-hydroxymuconate tautomerase [Amycolatopsis rhabdoformis]|uniref:2-hydroxymuconate tautomerase n=1 Tax=Amycolatopsis rhabdoformis TaxID=1448059 RepID=A0ABZ1I1R8_9PSEU|nr:2-hydroxymuconate tautomerase [Amycolatopsis rhabdoformis]WSE28089.1 2-hydroxymuconate tautomerase [Amycolatopsis rhabdoformis]